MRQGLADSVPALLRAELAKRNIRKSDFAAKLGVSEMWVYRRLTGAVDISLDDLQRMADALGVDPADFVEPAA